MNQPTMRVGATNKMLFVLTYTLNWHCRCQQGMMDKEIQFFILYEISFY